MSERNAFQCLSLAPCLTIGQEEIEAAWRSASQLHHPDAASSTECDQTADLVNQARSRLSKPAERLQEWLQAHGAPPPPRAAALSDDLMALFSTINAALSEADQTMRRSREAQTALARSLLAAAAIRAQKLVQEQLGAITRLSARIVEDEFAALEKETTRGGDWSKAHQVLARLKFLQKWEKECQQRLVELIALS